MSIVVWFWTGSGGSGANEDRISMVSYGGATVAATAATAATLPHLSGSGRSNAGLVIQLQNDMASGVNWVHSPVITWKQRRDALRDDASCCSAASVLLHTVSDVSFLIHFSRLLVKLHVDWWLSTDLFVDWLVNYQLLVTEWIGRVNRLIGLLNSMPTS